MTPEVYVNNEIMPLLLKAKCPLERVIKHDFRPVYYTKDFNDEGWQDCDAYYIPTQAQVMKWLREEQKCYIHNVPFYQDLNYSEPPRWLMAVDSKGMPYPTINNHFETYEEACEAAIKYCLENLI